MDRCDVLIVGGGPAGSTGAWRLVRAGLDVAVLDGATFPRDKVCTGWITPAVVRALELDLDDYGADRTLQPFTKFRTGPMDGDLLLTDFHRTVSYGIRRCEFDTYLLRRAGARLLLGQPLRELRRDGDDWVVNDAVRAPVVIGAGGHFCPVARHLNPGPTRDAVVIAQEIEFRIRGQGGQACPVTPESPELFFWPDLQGYGWCVRKGDYLNIGAGHLKEAEFPARVRRFASLLEDRGLVPHSLVGHWKGHAYLLNRTSTRRVYAPGLLLAGDAAGLALAPSGEGILSAVESGMMAADALIDAHGDYSGERLAKYGDAVDARFGPRATSRGFPRLPAWLTTLASRVLLVSPGLTRRFLLEDGFLHSRRTPYVHGAAPDASS